MAKRSACIFCRRRDIPLSKEDVLAKWIAREYGKSVFMQITSRNTGAVRVAKNNLGFISKTPCERCNNGWMSRLEKEAQPIIVKMMRAASFLITTSEKLTLARWILKTAIMYELTQPDARYFNATDRYNLFKSLLLPPSTLIFAAQFISRSRLQNSFATGVKTRTSRPPLAVKHDNNLLEVDAFTATFVIEAFAIQIFTLRRPPK